MKYTTFHTQPKKQSHILASLDLNVHAKKTQDNDHILPEILIIKESCNLIGKEALLITPGKKVVLDATFVLVIISMQKF